MYIVLLYRYAVIMQDISDYRFVMVIGSTGRSFPFSGSIQLRSERRHHYYHIYSFFTLQLRFILETETDWGMDHFAASEERPTQSWTTARAVPDIMQCYRWTYTYISLDKVVSTLLAYYAPLSRTKIFRLWSHCEAKYTILTLTFTFHENKHMAIWDKKSPGRKMLGLLTFQVHGAYLLPWTPNADFWIYLNAGSHLLSFFPAFFPLLPSPKFVYCAPYQMLKGVSAPPCAPYCFSCLRPFHHTP